MQQRSRRVRKYELRVRNTGRELAQTYCEVVHGLKALVGELEQQARLAYTGIAYDYILEQIGVCGQAQRASQNPQWQQTRATRRTEASPIAEPQTYGLTVPFCRSFVLLALLRTS